jgi:hypothetical protein
VQAADISQGKAAGSAHDCIRTPSCRAATDVNCCSPQPSQRPRCAWTHRLHSMFLSLVGVSGLSWMHDGVRGSHSAETHKTCPLLLPALQVHAGAFTTPRYRSATPGELHFE